MGEADNFSHYQDISDLEVTDKSIYYSKPATVFAAVAASIFTIIGVLGNLLTVLALLRCQKLRVHATTAFVISLAISDLLFSAINLPLTASRYIHEAWTLGDTLCRVFPFFFYGNVACSLMNMVAITVNRYVLITYHGRYNYIYSKTNIILMIFGVWMFSFGMILPPLLELWGTLGLDEATFSCTILKKDGKSPKKFFFIFGFLLPCIAIILCYSAIFYRVRQSRLNVQKHSTAPKPATKENCVASSQRKEDLRLTKMMLTIFISFLVCFLPLMLVNVVDDDVKIPTLHVVASVLAWMSATINPFIYAFKNRQYQLAFKKLLCCDTKYPGRSANRTTTSQASAQSRTDQSKTFITEMIHYKDNKLRIQSNMMDNQSSITVEESSHSLP